MSQSFPDPCAGRRHFLPSQDVRVLKRSGEPMRSVVMGAMPQIQKEIRGPAGRSLAGVDPCRCLTGVLSIPDRILVAKEGFSVEEWTAAGVSGSQIVDGSVH